MRTTIDIDDDLLKRAKIEAIERGTSLRDLVCSGLERELSAGQKRAESPRRVEFPLIAGTVGAKFSFSPEDLRKIEEDEDSANLR